MANRRVVVATGGRRPNGGDPIEQVTIEIPALTTAASIPLQSTDISSSKMSQPVKTRSACETHKLLDRCRTTVCALSQPNCPHLGERTDSLGDSRRRLPKPLPSETPKAARQARALETNLSSARLAFQSSASLLHNHSSVVSCTATPPGFFGVEPESSVLMRWLGVVDLHGQGWQVGSVAFAFWGLASQSIGIRRKAWHCWLILLRPSQGTTWPHSAVSRKNNPLWFQSMHIRRDLRNPRCKSGSYSRGGISWTFRERH